MSGTSQWPMSEAKMAWSCERRGLMRGVEGEGVHRVVGLAAEVALPGEHVDDVVDRARARSAPTRRSGRRSSSGSDRKSRPSSQPVDAASVNASAPCVAEQLGEQATVEVRRVVVGQGVAVALLQVPDHVGEQVARPGRAALEEGEAQLGEAGT